MSLPILQRCTDAPGTPLVFIHGIKGGRLVDGSGRTRWLTGATALGLTAPDLRLPLEWEDGVQRSDGLVPTTPVDEIRWLGSLARTRIYGRWLRTAASLGRPFYGFAYDWRRDNLESASRFEACVSAVRERHGGGPVQVVAHSMGGLIALVVLNRHAGWFRHVLFAGVPFRGGPGFLEDMHAGLPTGLNRRVTSPGMLFTCPAAYTLYPQGRSDCEDAAGNPVALDFYRAEDWVEHGLGVFADPQAATPARLTHLGHALERARRFRAELVHRELAYPPLTVLVSSSRPTLAVAVRRGPRSVRGWDLVSAPRQPGDGRVLLERALPPEGFRYRLAETGAEHGALLDDPGVARMLEEGVA